MAPAASQGALYISIWRYSTQLGSVCSFAMLHIKSLQVFYRYVILPTGDTACASCSQE